MNSLNSYSHHSENQGGGNKRGGGLKVVKSVTKSTRRGEFRKILINEEEGICASRLTEKLVILTADQTYRLNRRDELLETRRHQRNYLLVSLFKKPPDTTSSKGYLNHFLKKYFKTCQFSPNLIQIQTPTKLIQI